MDIEYVKHMIPHHQIALDMSEQIIRTTTNATILGIAREIIRSQNYEILEMKQMFSVNDTSHSVTSYTITDTDYLHHMIPHHQIAIDMSEKLLLHTNNTYLIVLANRIIIQQKLEIVRMTGLLSKKSFNFESRILAH